MATASDTGGRKKLWEVRGDYMCSVVGTCLTLAEIRKQARRDKLCSDRISDYDLHGIMVGACQVRSATSRALHKLLDRKHAGALRRARAAKTTEALRELWQQSVASGQAAGAYWALMTHPAVTPGLIAEAFGDVHMLSHLQGASRRADLGELEQAREAAEAERTRAAALRDSMREERAALEASRERVRALELSESQLRESLDEVLAEQEASSMARELASLRAEVEGLQAEVCEQRRRREAAERRGKRLGAALRESRSSASRLRGERDALVVEAAATEEQVSSLLSELQERQAGRDCATCPARFDLGGTCVLYVGGRQGMVRHYRELIERGGGRFVHHDGGLEDQKARLDVLVLGADVVLCPIDAVSHDACLMVKRACKRGARQFVPLRTSGVGSLAAALHELPGAPVAEAK